MKLIDQLLIFIIGLLVVLSFKKDDDSPITSNKNPESFAITVTEVTGTTADLQWETNLGGSAADEANSIRETEDGGYIIAGYSRSTDGDVGGNKGAHDFWIVKLK